MCQGTSEIPSTMPTGFTSASTTFELPPGFRTRWPSPVSCARRCNRSSPSNVFVVGGRAVLVDFGIAKSATAAPEDPALTAPGTVVGTLDYMAPEQERPSSGE